MLKSGKSVRQKPDTTTIPETNIAKVTNMVSIHTPSEKPQQTQSFGGQEIFTKTMDGF